jgi:biotin carboxyl carrier protein
MKMEHAVTSTLAGRVADVFVRVGEQVTRGQRLAIVEPT